MSKRNKSGLPSLTAREKEILRLVWEGLRNREIGDELKVSVKTVEVHRANIMKKLGARNAAQMIKTGIETGFIVPRSIPTA